jgi:hypothetical protein
MIDPARRMSGKKFVLLFFVSAIVIAVLATWFGYLGLRSLPR